jgi:hypothetical protein
MFWTLPSSLNLKPTSRRAYHIRAYIDTYIRTLVHHGCKHRYIAPRRTWNKERVATFCEHIVRSWVRTSKSCTVGSTPPSGSCEVDRYQKELRPQKPTVRRGLKNPWPLRNSFLRWKSLYSHAVRTLWRRKGLHRLAHPWFKCKDGSMYICFTAGLLLVRDNR